jgi:hypothetical protein
LTRNSIINTKELNKIRFISLTQTTPKRVGAGATRTKLRRTVAVQRPCPLGVWGESERPNVFGSFFIKKNNLFTKNNYNFRFIREF